MGYAGAYFKREPLPGVDYKEKRKSLKNFVKRTVLQARKSVFMYGNSQAAQDLPKDEVKELKREMNMSVSTSMRLDSIRSLQGEQLLPPPLNTPVKKRNSKSPILLDPAVTTKAFSPIAERVLVSPDSWSAFHSEPMVACKSMPI